MEASRDHPTSRPVEEAKLAGWHADFPFENDTQVFDVGEATAFGDVFQRQRGFSQQLLHAIQLHAQNLFVRRSSNESS